MLSTANHSERLQKPRGLRGRINRVDPINKLAGEPGFEPGLTDPESVVLPLDDSPACVDIIAYARSKKKPIRRRLCCYSQSLRAAYYRFRSSPNTQA